MCVIYSPEIVANDIKAMGLMKGYTVSAIKSQFTCSFKIYQSIVAFESFTGNGGGDGDINSLDDSNSGTKEELSRLSFRIKGALKAGRDVSKLSALQIKEWYDNGWFKLFNDRYLYCYYIEPS
jgi:hypothetical protein